MSTTLTTPDTRAGLMIAREHARLRGEPVCISQDGELLDLEPLTGKFWRVSPLGSATWVDRQLARRVRLLSVRQGWAAGLVLALLASAVIVSDAPAAVTPTMTSSRPWDLVERPVSPPVPRYVSITTTWTYSGDGHQSQLSQLDNRDPGPGRYTVVSRSVISRRHSIGRFGIETWTIRTRTVLLWRCQAQD